MRYCRTRHPSRWIDPETGAAVTIPKGSICIPLDWYFKRTGEPRVHEWEMIIDKHERLANGWAKEELNAMRQFLGGELLILDGLLRLMPSPVDQIKAEMTVSATKAHLARVEDHIAAGRLPILKETTKQQLTKKAEAFEKREYGDLLKTQSRAKAAGDQQHRLF